MVFGGIILAVGSDIVRGFERVDLFGWRATEIIFSCKAGLWFTLTFASCAAWARPFEAQDKRAAPLRMPAAGCESCSAKDVTLRGRNAGGSVVCPGLRRLRS